MTLYTVREAYIIYGHNIESLYAERKPKKEYTSIQYTFSNSALAYKTAILMFRSGVIEFLQN